MPPYIHLSSSTAFQPSGHFQGSNLVWFKLASNGNFKKWMEAVIKSRTVTQTCPWNTKEFQKQKPEELKETIKNQLIPNLVHYHTALSARTCTRGADQTLLHRHQRTECHRLQHCCPTLMPAELRPQSNRFWSIRFWSPVTFWQGSHCFSAPH